MKKIVVKTLKILVLCFLLMILAVNSIFLIKGVMNPDKVPKINGYAPLIIQSGSMKPTLNIGDLAIVKTTDVETLKEDDIIAFWWEKHVVVHRIMEIQEDENGTKQYITKGDNNNTQDKGYVSADEIEGILDSKIAKLGTMILFLQSPTGMILIVVLPILFIVGYEIAKKRRVLKAQEEEIALLQSKLKEQIEDEQK